MFLEARHETRKFGRFACDKVTEFEPVVLPKVSEPFVFFNTLFVASGKFPEKPRLFAAVCALAGKLDMERPSNKYHPLWSAD